MSRTDAFICDCLVSAYCGPGTAFEGDDPALHWPRIAFELRTGQNVWIPDEAGELRAWGSWYRVDDEALAVLEADAQDDWVRDQVFPELCSGRHCYISTVVVFPGAPTSMYRAVIDAVGDLNADAATLCGRLINRRGRGRWAARYNDGSAQWWRRCQSAAWRMM